jgi:acetyl esterase/lipase
MSREQRENIDRQLRAPHPHGPRSVEDMRTGFRAAMAAAIVPEAIRKTLTMLGSRPALLVESTAGEPTGTLLYFHGGGFVVGSPETALSLTGALVARTGSRAFSVEYRLAPEHPFPAANDDALGAYRALLESGVRPTAIALAGDSAGGCLAVATCLAARAVHLPMPAAVALFSPAVDATLTGDSMVTKAGIDPIFTRESIAQTLDMYLAGADPAHPFLSPALHADLTGLPPLLVQVGGNEVLLDDSKRLAARAQVAGVNVILDVTADVPHVFQTYAGALDEADEALDRAALFLHQHLR